MKYSSKSKKVISVILAALISLSIFSMLAFAAGEQGGVSAKYPQIIVYSQFYEGTEFKDTGKVTYQCYVRLREGDYDSGRVYSKQGGKSFDTPRHNTIGIQTYKWNNPFEDSTANWGFEYCWPQY